MNENAIGWTDSEVAIEVPMAANDGHHAMASAAFTWDDVED